MTVMTETPPADVNALLDALDDAEAAKKTNAGFQYRAAVAAISNGEVLPAEKLRGILAAAGKSTDDLRSDLDQCRRVEGAFAAAEKLPAASARRIEAANERLRWLRFWHTVAEAAHAELRRRENAESEVETEIRRARDQMTYAGKNYDSVGMTLDQYTAWENRILADERAAVAEVHATATPWPSGDYRPLRLDSVLAGVPRKMMERAFDAEPYPSLTRKLMDMFGEFAAAPQSVVVPPEPAVELPEAAGSPQDASAAQTPVEPSDAPRAVLAADTLPELRHVEPEQKPRSRRNGKADAE